MVTFGTYSSNHLVADRPSRPSSPNFEMVEPGANPMDTQGCGGAIKRKQGTKQLQLRGREAFLSNVQPSPSCCLRWKLDSDDWILDEIKSYSRSTTVLVLLWLGKSGFLSPYIITPEISPGICLTLDLWVVNGVVLDPAFRPPWWVEYLFQKAAQSDGSRWLHWGLPKNMLNIWVFPKIVVPPNHPF